MLKFAANITSLFKELEYLERFSAAANAGFKAIESGFPYQAEASRQKELLEANQLEMILINTPPGDPEKGDRGLASVPGREKEFQENIALALEYAALLNCGKIHVMAGVLQKESLAPQHEEVFLQNISFAGREAARQNCMLMIEPINTFDMPGYFMNTPEQAVSFLEKVDLPNVRLQFDVYHCQMMRGHLEYQIRTYFQSIEHIQISAVPHRTEPDQGEINYPHIFSLLEELEYPGWVGCEYNPRGDTLQGLSWLENLVGDWQ